MARRTTLDVALATTNAVTTSNSAIYNVERSKTIAIQAIVDVNTPAAKTFAGGTSEVQTITVPNGVLNAADGDFGILTDPSGTTWGFYLDTTGLAGTVPTGATYIAIPAGRKTAVDISLAASNTAVGDAIRSALNVLTGFTAAITLSGTTTVIATMIDHDPCTNPSILAADGIASATNFSGVQTTGGVASDVDITANTISEVGHGYTTGLKGQLTTTGTLPAGVTTGVDYFIIAIDDDTYSLASSLVLAQAGTAIDLTDQGTSAATHTFTPTALAGATVSFLYSIDGVNFDLIEAATAITVDAHIILEKVDPGYKYLKVSYTLTAGRLSAVTNILIKEDV